MLHFSWIYYEIGRSHIKSKRIGNLKLNKFLPVEGSSMYSCSASGCSAIDASFSFPSMGPLRKRWFRNLGLSSSSKDIDRKGRVPTWIRSGEELLVCWRHFPEEMIKTVKLNQHAVQHFKADSIPQHQFVPSLTLDQAKARKESVSPTFRHSRETKKAAKQRVLFEKTEKDQERVKSQRKRLLTRERVRAHRAKRLRSALQETKSKTAAGTFLSHQDDQPESDSGIFFLFF